MHPNVGARAVLCAVTVAVAAALALPARAATEPTRWVRVASPNVSGDSYTNLVAGVSCWSPRGCFAVGSRFTSSGLRQTFVMSWNGTAWRIVGSPNRGSGDNALTAVSCPRPSMCLAVGWDENPADGPLVETWDGGSWALAAVPLTSPVATEAVTLAGVSCSTPTRCVAVGGYDPDGQRVRNLALRMSTSRWSFAKLPSPGTKSNELTAVSCANGRHCVAVGEHSDRTQTFARVTLAETMTGRKWKLTPTPNPTPASAAGIPYNHLAGVSCPTTNHCVAVGEYHSNSTADLQTLVETWNGHRWTRTKSPNKPQGSNNDSRLRSVACASTLACTAVGSFAPNNPSQTLVETWNGVRWAIRRSPDAKPAGIITTNELTSVSCVSPFACAAVGDTMAGFTADSNTITQTLTLFGPAVPRPHVRLTPTRSTPAIGLAQCLQAKVTDTAGHRLVRTPVAFKVTGANSHKSTKRTDRSGVATFCYVGRRAGVDHVVATVYGIGSNRAKVSWTKH